MRTDRPDENRRWAAPAAAADEFELDDRQALVLRSLVSAYIADGAPVSSGTLSHLLPVSLSSASIRSTLAQLADLGLVDQPHTSAGRIPSDAGLRVFLDRLFDPADISDYERRALEERVDAPEGEPILRVVSQVLSDRTRQIGFALEPVVERLPLTHVTLVRVSTERVLVVLVAANGQVTQRTIEERGDGDQRELDQMARALNERLSGRTLGQVHAVLRAEIERLRDQADRLLKRALTLGLRALDAGAFTSSDLVVATRLAILDQPEFADPARIRAMLSALETHERLIEVLEQIIDSDGFTVSLGDDLAESGLRGCAMVAVPYGRSRPGGGDEGGALGVVGVIGPNRMDYSRIVPVVSYCSSLVTRRLQS